jgi:RNA polymerase sigma factor (sigma-70 family)
VNETEDYIIIRKVLSGDVNAFSKLVADYKDLAFTLAFNIILNGEDAEEVVQDAFVNAYKSLHRFKNESKFSTWFYRIVVNASLNKRKIKKIHTVTNEPELLADAAFDISALDNYKNEEQKKFIKLSMAGLNEKERICITMYYLNELSMEEINELTGISIASVKVLLYRGRKSLYIQLEKLLQTEVKNLI